VCPEGTASNLVRRSWVADLTPEVVHQPEPRHLPHLVLEVDQQFGEPPRIIAGVQPSDQRDAIGVGPLDDR
jgi:hypothetical protein